MYSIAICSITLALFAINFTGVEPLIQANDAEKGQFPYMASIAHRGQNAHCGGAIINSYYVVSSGQMLYVYPKGEFIVYLGAWKYHDSDAISSLVAEIKIHPNLDAKRRLNNIALLRMDNEIEFSDSVKPIALPTVDFPRVYGETLLISGFGSTEKSNNYEQTMKRSSILQYFNTTSLTLLECTEKFEEALHFTMDREKEFSKNIICTENPAGKAMCFGDLGNPLVSNGTLVGIASWGCACQSEIPGVYTRIYSYIDWIVNESKEIFWKLN